MSASDAWADLMGAGHTWKNGHKVDLLLELRRRISLIILIPVHQLTNTSRIKVTFEETVTLGAHVHICM